MKYEFDVLTALLKLDKPTTKKIVSLTGISERKVQTVIKSLVTELGMKLEKIKEGRSFYYVIDSWGVFESGEKLKKTLKVRDFNTEKTIESKGLIFSYSQKKKYFEKVKMRNFKESMRLEGHSISIDSSPKKPKDIKTTKTQLIEKYKMLSKAHG